MSALALLACAQAQLAAPGVASAAARAARPAAAPPVTLYAWGANQAGQVGNGSTGTAPSPVPVRLPRGAFATGVAGGADFALAVASGGAVYAWGSDRFGQLGPVGPGPRRALPVRVPGLAAVTDVAAGAHSSYAITAGGALLAWGSNRSGQLGNGIIGGWRARPARVALPRGVRALAVAAGAGSAYAIGSDGRLYAWGANHAGQLGNGSWRASARPVRVALSARPDQIAAGAASAYALTTAGTIEAWGDNHRGQLGTTVAGPVSARPVAVSFPAFTSPVTIAAGARSGYAVGLNGTAYAWGANNAGQLGNGRAADSWSPVRVRLPGGVIPVEVSGGRESAYAADAGGDMYAWGGNSAGQLGNGSTSFSSGPVRTSLPTGTDAMTGPEPLARTGYAVAAQPGVRDERKNAVLKLNVDGPGPTIKIVGGGGGKDHSNCTNDETNTTMTAGKDPTFATIGYIAKSSGGCALEPSYSFFSITVTGTTASGKPIAAVGRIYFGQDRSGDDYGAFCDGPFVNMTCQKTADRELVLTASTN